MKLTHWLILAVLLGLVACGAIGSDQIAVAELPDPAIYALNLAELPDVGLNWEQTYNQTTTNEGFKWSYRAYQAYQPGSLGEEMESAFAVNNDVALYEVNMRQANLPPPPQALGNIQNVSWKGASLSHRLGDKSAVWKTSLGELMTPVWWLEFYQGHAYVRISLLGFPDQIAPPILYGLGDIVSKRLPRSADSLRQDAATVIATQPAAISTAIPPNPPVTGSMATPTPEMTLTPRLSLPVTSYAAPPGETGMVSFFDDTGKQLTDGVLGSNDILADQGNGTAYEWVGWTELTDPVSLTFTLEGTADVAAVQIGINHRDGLGIFVPASVTINGSSFDLQAEAVPNNQRGEVTFSGPFHGPVVEITLHHRGRGWILVDEVKFLAEP